MLSDMQNTQKTAGQTAKTNKGWGIVAVISVMVAITCFGNLWITGISVALFAFSAWKGGYMDETVSHNARQSALNQAQTEERRVA